jgi:hypothetical protein
VPGLRRSRAAGAIAALAAAVRARAAVTGTSQRRGTPRTATTSLKIPVHPAAPRPAAGIRSTLLTIAVAAAVLLLAGALLLFAARRRPATPPAAAPATAPAATTAAPPAAASATSRALAALAALLPCPSRPHPMPCRPINPSCNSIRSPVRRSLVFTWLIRALWLIGGL